MARDQGRSTAQSESGSIPPARTTLAVENFGPIAKAEIELRPLTIFVGRSNTGKSYMAILAYVMHQIFGIRRHHSTDEGLPLQSPAVNLLHRNLLRHPDRLEIITIMTSMIQKAFESDLEDNSEGKIAVPEHVLEMIRGLLTPPAGLADLVARYLVRYFGLGSDVHALRREGASRPLRITVAGSPDWQTENDHPMHQYMISIGKRQMKEEYTGATVGEVGIKIDPVELVDDMISESMLSTLRDSGAGPAALIWNMLFGLLAATRTAIFGLRPATAYYLPAGRTGLMHAHPAIGSALFDQAADLPTADNLELPMLSGLLSDFMRHLIPTNRIKSNDDEIAKIAEEFEQDVLSGRVSRKRSPSNYPSFTYEIESPELSIPLRNASSMISELAPLGLLLRERIEIGDILVIEEPEGHLHPAAQMEMARILVKLVNKGVQVIVTTHSEWLLDQFANLVRMSTLSDREREGLNGADATLDPKYFGAWLFSPRKKGSGSIVTEWPVDSKFDGTLSDYSDVAEQIYNTWAEIGNRIADRAES